MSMSNPSPEPTPRSDTPPAGQGRALASAAGHRDVKPDTKKPMPPEMIIPMLVCRSASAEIEFCKTAFGAVELSRRIAQGGAVLHAALRVGAAMIMVHGEVPTFASRAPKVDGSSAVVIYLYLLGVDAAIERAIAAGARLLLPAQNAPWGDRVGRIVDPEGHVWNIASRSHERHT